MRITFAQRRYLVGMLGEDGGTLNWNPVGSDELRCAYKLVALGLVKGYLLSRGSEQVWLTDKGLKVAKSLASGAAV